MTVRRCPRCNQTYQAPARYCVNDGSLLVEESAPPPGATPSHTPRPRFDDLSGAAAFGPLDLEAPAPAVNPLSTLSGQVLDRRYRVA